MDEQGIQLKASCDNIASLLEKMSYEMRKELSKRSSKLIDGLGVTRIAEGINRVVN